VGPGDQACPDKPDPQHAPTLRGRGPWCDTGVAGVDRLSR
jgi:hypothetical protein